MFRHPTWFRQTNTSGGQFHYDIIPQRDPCVVDEFLIRIWQATHLQMPKEATQTSLFCMLHSNSKPMNYHHMQNQKNECVQNSAACWRFIFLAWGLARWNQPLTTEWDTQAFDKPPNMPVIYDHKLHVKNIEKQWLPNKRGSTRHSRPLCMGLWWFIRRSASWCILASSLLNASSLCKSRSNVVPQHDDAEQRHYVT